MIDPQTLLEIQLHDGTGYTDLKLELGVTGKLPTISLTEGSYLYIGYHKPIKSVYFDIKTPNTVANTLSIEHSKPNNEWLNLKVFDETYGFTKSGYIQWLELDKELISEIEINNITKYWIRIKVSADNTDAIWNFVGLILSTDSDLLLENPYILDQALMMGQSSHINAHISARNEIIQSLSNKGTIKSYGSPKRLTFWDILDIQEFRQGSMFLALSKIYFNLSDNKDDTWLAKSKEYRKFYLDQIDLYFKTIDINDDGVTSNTERSAISTTKTIYR